MNPIKNYFINRKLKKWITGDKSFTEGNRKISNVLILLDLDSKGSEVDYEEVFKNLPFQLRFLGYKKQSSKTKVPSLPYFTLQDISLTGIIKKSTAVDLLSEPVDLLLLGFQRPIKPLLLAVPQVHTGLRVGFGTQIADYADIIIQLPRPETEIVRNELLKYLKALNKI